MPITTFTRLTSSSPSSNLLDDSSPAGKAFLATIDDALAQEACKKVHFGREVEEEGNYWVFAEWDSMEDRMAYVKSEAFQALSKALFGFVDGTKILSKHFTPSSDLSPVSSVSTSPAIEVVSLHFPPTISDSHKSEAYSLLYSFQTQGLETSKDFLGTAGGWSVESDVPVLGDERGEVTEGKAMMLLLGWTSVEAHFRNCQTEEFKKAMPLFRGKMPGTCGFMMCHVKPVTR